MRQPGGACTWRVGDSELRHLKSYGEAINRSISELERGKLAQSEKLTDGSSVNILSLDRFVTVGHWLNYGAPSSILVREKASNWVTMVRLQVVSWPLSRAFALEPGPNIKYPSMVTLKNYDIFYEAVSLSIHCK